MGLIKRGDKRYYIQSVRVGGRVTSKYLGSGERAELCALIAALRRNHERDALAEIRAEERDLRESLRERRRAERAALRAAVAQREADLAPWLTMFARVEALTHRALYEAGWHRPRRQWRRRRSLMSKSKVGASKAGPPAKRGHPAGAVAPEPRSPSDISKALDKVIGKELRRQFDIHVAIDQCNGDLGRLVLRAVVRDLESVPPHARAEVLAHVDRLAEELAGGPDADPLMQLVARRAALAWLELHALELSAAVDTPHLSAKELGCRMRWSVQASRRFHQAVRSVATVRRLLGSVQPRGAEPLPAVHPLPALIDERRRGLALANN
jgi:hypothetical protein